MEVRIERYGTQAEVAGLPADGRFVPVSYSDLSRLPCRRRFWFSVVEGLRSSSSATARGSGWDELVGDVYRWWIEEDKPYQRDFAVNCPWCEEDGSCASCGGTGAGVLARIRDLYEEMVDNGDLAATDFDAQHEIERLARSLDGYLRWYEGGPLQEYRAVAAQARVARPVLSPATGRPYATEVLLVRTEHGWQHAGTGGVALATQQGGAVVPLHSAGARDVATVTWPVYLVGTLDFLMRHRTTAKGWVVDAKYTKNVSTYDESLRVDPQLPGYCWLLEPHLDRFGLSGVAGFGYDLTDSRYQNDPKELKWQPPSMETMKALAEERGISIPKGLRKSEDLQKLVGITPGHGGFSHAANQGVPSWRFKRAIQKAGLKVEDYADLLTEIEASFDGGLYRRIYAPFTEHDLHRFEAELFSRAQQAMELRRAAARAKHRTDLDVAFPRTPLCSMPGGHCPFLGPCSNDSSQAREGYERGTGVAWSTAAGSQPGLFGNKP